MDSVVYAALLALFLFLAAPAQAADCAGDCTTDGQVTVDEVLTLGNIALGKLSITVCPAGEMNGDEGITIDDLLAAVASALNGCPVVVPTPSPTPSSTPSPDRTAPPSSSPTDSPTATTPPPRLFCREPAGGLTIPDGDAADGVTDAMTVPDLGVVTGLRVHVTIEHGFVGDLIVELAHVDTDAVALLLDAPGFPPDEYGCNMANVDCIFDDAARVEAETMCNATPPAIGGAVLPIDALSPLTIDDVAGTWELTVWDEIFEYQGRLLRWCLEFQ